MVITCTNGIGMAGTCTVISSIQNIVVSACTSSNDKYPFTPIYSIWYELD